jgi:hypothetical protein
MFVMSTYNKYLSALFFSVRPVIGRLPGMFGVVALLCLASCKKLVSVPEPINSLTTVEVFSSDAQANSALAGIYTAMINGTNGVTSSAYTTFSDGLTTILGGLSSDDLFYNNSGAMTVFNTNALTAINAQSTALWTMTYSFIYNANATISGIAASSSGALHDSVRTELIGEAKFIRAFCYFYLTNIYGDVPLSLTVDFNQTTKMARTPQSQVYAQIVQDLKDAQAALPVDYSVGKGERIRPNKWAATALLARVYLYTGQFADAASQATEVIDNTSLYALTADLNEVFDKNSMEAIWQLQQGTSIPSTGTATPEGMAFLPNPLSTGFSSFILSPSLLSAFETGDHRRSAWVDSTDNSASGSVTGLFFYPYKYKTGASNYSVGGAASEYYMVLRLAEQYLIRAEAAANGGPGGAAAAIQDLNVIRARAGLAPLSSSLTSDQVLAAVAHERQVELFAEWGHRWMDLRRTGQAHAVLSQISYKQPWQGDYQLLYPIPIAEITADPALIQNTGY